MLDRASTFSDPEVIDLLKTRFVPVAVDLWPLHRSEDAEGEFYRKVADQGPRKVPQNTQGLYAFDVEGRLLGFTHRAHEFGDRPDHVRNLLRKVLADFQFRSQPPDAAPVSDGRKDPRSPRAPEGGLVLDVTSRVLGGYSEPRNELEKIFQTSMGMDHLWVRKDEAEALARGEFPESLAKRIARFHLVDATRGEPPLWEPEEVRTLEVALAGGTVSGRARMETASGRRGAELDLRGEVELKDGKVVRFDLVAKGVFRAGGRAPKGRYPVAIAFRRVEGNDEADRVPPQGLRERDYLR